MAEAAWEKWGSDTRTKVEMDCYCLAQLPHYGFTDVDTHVRGHFGIERNDVRRIGACLEYYLGKMTEEDTVVGWNELYDKVSHAIDSDPNAINDACSTMIKAGALVAFPKTGKLALRKDFLAETELLKFVLDRRELPAPEARQAADDKFALDSVQMDAVRYALGHTFAIINGGAGCGKTTIVKTIIHSLGPTSVELCAFAGKAAARLKEATGCQACTIHHMLEYRGDDLRFSRKTLAGISVVVDEASMVSSDLMAEIVKRNPKRLILVGDEAQLPPVGSGQPFHDLVKLAPDSVKTLTTCYRNKEAIFTAASQIRNGYTPTPELKSAEESWSCVNDRDLRDTHSKVLEMVESGKLDFGQDAILCCRNGETDDDWCSIRTFNENIKSMLNPNRDGSYKIAAGDRIINTENDAGLDVWNGTTGTCHQIDVDGAMWVDLDFPTSAGEMSVLIPKENVKKWKLAYALTVHKSQGSQYRKVVFVVARRDVVMLLSRSMVYTAVTRAKKECVVIGDMNAFQTAIGKIGHKQTVMQELAK